MAVTRKMGGSRRIEGGNNKSYTINLTGVIVDATKDLIIANDLAIDAANQALANEYVEYVNRIIPRKKGKLAESVDVKKNGTKSISIQYRADYAYWQNRGYTSGPVTKYTTPGTQAKFREAGQQWLQTLIEKGEYATAYKKQVYSLMPKI